MYLYLAFFNEDIITGGKCYFSKQYLNNISKVFPDYKDLNSAEIEGCIGFLKGAENKSKNCYVLNIETIEANDNYLSLEFDNIKELDISNEFIDKSIYKFAVRSDWINSEFKYSPLVCILNKEDFDLIRKGEVKKRKQTSISAKIEELYNTGNWIEMCNFYEPLEELSNNDEAWSSAEDLFKIGFACSKLGEPQNGLERDKNHLLKVERYRDLSLLLYKRCDELAPTNFRYASAVAYRHYQNINELTKPKGRRDGSIANELQEALQWYDKVLAINPNSIKDNYRKGKLILDKQVDRLKKEQKEWTREVYLKIEEIENNGVDCLEKAIAECEKLETDKSKKYYLNEYIKALYCLGCYFIDKPKSIWNEYVCCKLLNERYNYNGTREDMGDILKAKQFFEKCFQAETDISLEEDFDITAISHTSKGWAESPMDKLYRLGQVYLEMFLLKYILNGKENPKVMLYGQKCERYLKAAKQIGDEFKRTQGSGRNTSFISEKLAHYYMISGNPDQAIRLIENLRESYIKNTYAIALLLSNMKDRFSKAETALKIAQSDNYNQAKDISIVLMAYVFKLSGDKEKFDEFITEKKSALNYAGNRLLTLLERQEGNHES